MAAWAYLLSPPALNERCRCSLAVNVRRGSRRPSLIGWIITSTPMRC